MHKYDRFTLDNGLRIIAQPMPAFRSTAIGIWLRAGSVDETAQSNGYSHFIEHLLFKGTQSRSAKDLAEEMDLLGGHVNAFTSKECTCFHAKVMDEQISDALELLSDLVLNAKFDPGDIEKEKGVVLEEISMVEDSPEDVVHDLIASANFGETPLSRTILGPAQNIQEVTRESILAYKDSLYSPHNCVVSVAGSYDKDELLRLVERYLGGWQGRSVPERNPFKGAEKRQLYREKPIEQAHLCLGFDGIPQGDDRVYPLSIFNSVFGGGMSSRLFQKIREEQGLAYTVYSYPSSYVGVGVFTIYAGTSPKNVQAVIDTVAAEIQSIKKSGITKDEFDKAKIQLKGGYILSQESAVSRMNAIGRNALMLNRFTTEEETIGKIEATTMDDVMEVMELLLSSPMSAALIGNGCTANYSVLAK
ncbi:MAG: M16 family metallopeptidase [Christensenellales bacterium]|jgi:predicted Zn-dependent peptidase